MSDNENWRAKCDEPGCILVRPHPWRGPDYFGFDVAAAVELRDQLTAAIEEARRLEDPFERYWEGLQSVSGLAVRYMSSASAGVFVTKTEARALWDAIRKAQ